MTTVPSRRRDARVPLRAPATLLTPYEGRCIVVDRNSGGLGILAQRPIRAGECLLLTIHDPGGNTAVTGEVVWWRKQGALARVGLRYLIE